MQIKKKLNIFDNVYIIFLLTVLIINIILTSPVNAISFKITDLEVAEPFELNFNKNKVINEGFKKAFIELVSILTISEDKNKIKNTSISVIKTLIDSFTISNEKFVNNKYIANFDVNFNKKKTLIFFEKKNIFPSIPHKKKLLLIPILVDLQSDKIVLFNNNIFYDEWNRDKERYFLLNYLLPSEDLEEMSFISENSEMIEDYDFKKTINKYDLNDFIITILYKDNNELKVLSKIQLNNFFKIDNQKFENINLSSNESVNLVLSKLKNTYENYWKNMNQINTSIKLPLSVSLNSKEYKKIQYFENSMHQIDLVSSFEIFKFNNNKTYFKLIYNGTPNKFIEDIKSKNMKIDTQDQIWEIK
jgi:hypothetical protein